MTFATLPQAREIFEDVDLRRVELWNEALLSEAL